MKKLLCCACAAILLLSFAGCNGKTDAGETTIKFKRHPRTVYETGDPFGEFSLAVIENGKTTFISWDTPGVSVEGFDSSEEGERTAIIRYKDYVKTFAYIVLLPEALRPPEPGDVTVYTLEELQNAFKEYDNIDVEGNLTVEEGKTFTVPAGKRVAIKSGYALFNRGTLFNNGSLQGEVKGKSAIKEPTYLPDSGTFVVRNGEELAWCSWAIYNAWDTVRWNGAYNNGGGANRSLDGFSHYTISIENDIDLSAHEWIPLGYWQYDSYEENTADGWLPGLAHTFKGVIQGNGHTLTGINIGSDGEALARNVGFIGVADYEASVYDLTLKDVAVCGTDNVGALMGYYHSHSWADGYIENVRVVNGNVSGENSVGGLFGRITNTIQGCRIDISDCSFEGSVSFAGDGTAAREYIGGIAGYTENCVFIVDCTVTATLADCANGGGRYFGGIVGGWQSGTIADIGGPYGRELNVSGNDFSGVDFRGFDGEVKEIGNR